MADKRELRKKLEALIRGPSPPPRVQPTEVPADAERQASGSQRRGTPGEIIYRRDLPRTQPKGPSAPSADLPPLPLGEAAEGREIVSPIGRPTWLVEQRITEMPGGWELMCRTFCEALRRPGTGLRWHLQAVSGDSTRPDGSRPGDVRCEDLIFLDLETTGLGNLPLFLIGTMVWEDGGFVVRQYFARDYSEERAILSVFFQAAADRKVLVSFNGKTFDVPFLRVRAAAGAVACALPDGHLDLLHVSRRTWRDLLPDCRLQTLERHVCKRIRGSDLPGELIPEAYHAFVRTGNAAQMAECFRHNRLDLITLADLMTRLPGRRPSE